MENQWSVNCPPGNRKKMKMLMTPFGTFTDSMNLFNTSLSEMAKSTTDLDVKELYKLHLSYLKNRKHFKDAFKKRETFSISLFKTVFKEKLIFPYNSFDDLDWLLEESDSIPDRYCIILKTTTQTRKNQLKIIINYFNPTVSTPQPRLFKGSHPIKSQL